MNSRFVAMSICTVCLLINTSMVRAQHPATNVPEEPKIAGKSDEGERAIKGFSIPEGMKIELVAAEPDVANPVAISIDEQGRIYVAETFRQGKGIEDNRGHGHWLDDDLAAESIEDRLAYIKKHLKEKAIDYTKHDDRIRLLEDTSGDGIVDKATVFSDRYNGILEGTGAGVLARQGEVFYTNIPHLWKLRDTDGDGKADDRQSLHVGYGVRFALRGHDMHGLVIGPDGKLYYSIGDRGYNVKSPEGKHFKDPTSGAVFRCNLDGSDLELFAYGLRNPQELAFDDYGNLFTGDNNSDSGDKARWVYIVEGGDTGWRMYYQYVRDRGPFNREKIWHPAHAGQPAYIVPPVTNLGNGPSGLTYYPGTGLGEEYRGSFFLCDFRGGAGNSTIHTFKVKNKGAGFELVDRKNFVSRLLATDADFGPDGAFYISDWVNGWNGLGKGRIYRLTNPKTIDDAKNQEAKKLISEGFSQRNIKELVGLLTHPNRTVRQESQFALVEKKAAGELQHVAKSSDNQLARIHGIWGLGMLARTQGSTDVLNSVVALLNDGDTEIRCQAAKVLGDARFAKATAALLSNFTHENERVRYFAAIAVGKIGASQAVPSILQLLADNADQDAILRHGGIMALKGCADDKMLASLATHNSASVRVAAVVALRKLRSSAVRAFLHDVAPLVVREAASAIYDDLRMDEAMPDLAALITVPTSSDSILRRVLAANNRLGTPAAAEALARFAGSKTAPESSRLEALNLLKNWANPTKRDTVSGMWRPLKPRDREAITVALTKALPGILGGSQRVRTEGAKLAASYGIKEIRPALESILNDPQQSGSDRADALSALVDLKGGEPVAIIKAGLSDEHPIVRTRARALLAAKSPKEALAELQKAISSDELVERQGALATLAKLTQVGTNAIIAAAMDDLLDDKFPADTRLDLVLAAKNRASRDIRSQLSSYDKQASADDPLARYRDTLTGGNAERGRDLFFHKAELSCVRCHRHNSVGGDVGPDLTKIGKDQKAAYLMEAIAAPNKAIAKGFETVNIVDDNGKIHAGILKSEDDKVVKLMTAEGKLITIAKESIDERGGGKSAMPEDIIKHLNERDIRDLVEFLKGS